MIFKSEYSKNILTLMTGTTIAQAIPIAISPVLTRLYSPEDFGILALFMAISTIFGSIASARYELAIMLPKSNSEAVNLAFLGLFITTIISVFLSIVIYFCNGFIVSQLNNEEIGMWLYFIPVVVFLMGSFNVLNYLGTRNREYKAIAKANVLKSIVLSALQLSIGFFKTGVVGLISGQIVSQVVLNFLLVKSILKNSDMKKEISITNVFAVAKKYKTFPKYSMWAILANTSSQHLINVLISTFYSIGVLGFYSLVQKILIMPMLLLGNAVSQVFYQEATNIYHSKGSMKHLFIITMKKLIFLAFPIFMVLFFIIEDLFAFIFSEKWRIAGEYAQIILPLYFIRFVVSSFTVIPIIYKRVDIDLIFQIILLVVSSIIILISYLIEINFETYLMYHMVGLCFVYMSYFLYIYKTFVEE